jgi:hypothetical protein
MSTSTMTEYETILQTVGKWPAMRRFSLVHDVLKTLEPEGTERPRKHTLATALGLLKTNQPAPSDEEVARILHEARMEKYG